MTETKTPWLDRIAHQVRASGAHPARTVVLLPYAQLLPVAARAWAQQVADGFCPRFETTQSWVRSLGGFVPDAVDIHFDAALDMLTAQAMLESAGWGAQADTAAPLLMQAAWQLADQAAAVRPDERAAWGQRMRGAAQAGLGAAVLALEAAVAQLALTWTASSAYASDVLLTDRVLADTECLIVLQGFQPEPLSEALLARWGARALRVHLHLDEPGTAPVAQAYLAWHAARDVQDEAQRAAACVLQHLQAGRQPVALVALDRVLTRRVRAMLAGCGVPLRDETGWKLSTSRAGAHVMVALRACAWNARSDAVLDWLKHGAMWRPARVSALEAWLRREAVRDWRQVAVQMARQTALATGKAHGAQPGQPDGGARQAALADLAALVTEVEPLRSGLARSRPLAQWVAALRALLQHSGQWTALQNDVAGVAVLKALRLHGAHLPEDALWSGRRLSLADFSRWVDRVLEAESFQPTYPAHEQVVILPLPHLLGRSFAALVVPGCDEVRLPAAPEPAPGWTPAQRVALGLPAREALAAAQRAAWHHAMRAHPVDVLWRMSDETGEPLQPSVLLQQVLPLPRPALAADPRPRRRVEPRPLARPLPTAAALPVTRLSASAYSDLRHCPYRFFALRQLGLQQAEELEVELDKRDFGQWLHAVLKLFHDGLRDDPEPADRWPERLDAAAQAVTQTMRLAEDEFLPFQAAWPRVRDGYLDWLGEHGLAGMHYAEGERWLEQPLGAVTLVGRIDRIDRTGQAGELMVIDYKTEAQAVTAARLKEPLEDTQLAFYAALLPAAQVQAAYVNVGEKDGSRTYAQEDVMALREALCDGITHDMRRIAAGAALPALGEGDACEFCAARGLCRRDFWPDNAQEGAQEGVPA